VIAEDERSIANKLERESKRENEAEEEKDLETKQLKQDPTLPVRTSTQYRMRSSLMLGTGESARQ
jgi:hypothetical protein